MSLLGQPETPPDSAQCPLGAASPGREPRTALSVLTTVLPQPRHLTVPPAPPHTQTPGSISKGTFSQSREAASPNSLSSLHLHEWGLTGLTNSYACFRASLLPATPEGVSWPAQAFPLANILLAPQTHAVPHPRPGSLGTPTRGYASSPGHVSGGKTEEGGTLFGPSPRRQAIRASFHGQKPRNERFEVRVWDGLPGGERKC